MIKAIIFDMDGVLIDSELFYMNKTIDILKEYFDIKITHNDLIELPGANHQQYKKVITDILIKHHRNYEEYEIANQKYNKSNPMDFTKILSKDVISVLEWLDNHNIRMSIASSSKKIEIDEMLTQNNLQKYFEFILSGESFRKSKPHPEIYLQSIQKLQLTRNEIVVIEDSEYGIQAAKDANLKVIAKRDINFNFNQEIADIQIDNLIEIIGIVKKCNH